VCFDKTMEKNIKLKLNSRIRLGIIQFAHTQPLCTHYLLVPTFFHAFSDKCSSMLLQIMVVGKGLSLGLRRQ
jgi:hypothetical protein